MVKKSNMISTRWISETCDEFRAFLQETDFPAPERIGERGPFFKYPEWLIMFIATGQDLKRSYSFSWLPPRKLELSVSLKNV